MRLQQDRSCFCTGVPSPAGRFPSAGPDDPGRGGNDEEGARERIGCPAFLSLQQLPDGGRRDAGYEKDRRPDQTGEDVRQPEASRRHFHHARDEWNDRAHGTEETSDEDALAAVLLEKAMPVGEKLGPRPEGPHVGDEMAEAKAQPIGNAVTQRRAHNAANEQRNNGHCAVMD